MIELTRFIRSKLAMSRLLVIAAAALLGGVVVTGVLAGPNGLLAGPGGDDGDTPQEVATSTPVPTPDPGTEIVGDVIDCPSGEDTRFKFEQEGGEFEVTGLLVSLDDSSVVVTGPDGDVTAAVALNTEVKGDLQPGDPVKVEGAVLGDGTFVAREVKAACEEPEPTPAATPTPEPAPAVCEPEFKFEVEDGEFEVKGVLVSFDGSTVVVAGPDGDVTAAVGADAEVKGEPQPGDPVKVEGVVLDNGSFDAREIEPSCADADDDENDGDDDDDGNDEHEDGDEDGEHEDGDEDGDHADQDDNQGEGHGEDGEED